MAVGEGFTPRNLEFAWSASWNGKRWEQESTVTPAGAATTELSAVSCTSNTACLAVGSYGRPSWLGGDLLLAEIWNGRRWVLDDPRSHPSSNFNAVSCVTDTWCVAVGRGADVPGALAEGWTGKSWSLEPVEAGKGQLNGVSCLSKTNCFAVGGQSLAGAQTVEPSSDFVEEWTGNKWSLQPSVSPEQAQTQLQGVSCVTATWCAAVGTDDPARGSAPKTGVGKPAKGDYVPVEFTESLVGRSWHLGGSPGLGDLTAVSCRSIKLCFALGSVQLVKGVGVTSHVVAAIWNGDSWSLQTPPSLTANDASGTGISCISATVCMAVGSSADGPLSEIWNGVSWKTVPVVPGSS
jgi:hypothetical protein